MKKILLVVTFLIALTACGGNEVIQSEESSITANAETSDTVAKTEEYEQIITDLEAEIESLKTENETLNENVRQLETATSVSEVDVESSQAPEVTPEKKEVYGPGETWQVDGLFSLTIDSVTRTDERNQFSDKNPAEVVVITYTYENLGYEGSIQDLYITPDNVIDGSGEVASLYPASTDSARPTPIGAKMTGAQEAYGLNNQSETIKVMFKVYGNDYDSHKATFEIPVE